MENLIDQLANIKGYSYQIWKYQRGHSEMTIRATHHGKKGHNIHLIFLDVQYFQFPLGWVGDLYPASETELIEIVKRTNFRNQVDNAPIELLQEMYSLYKAISPGGVIYILGKLIKIEYDVEPIYD
jgi:hypothetical protein